MHKTPSICLLLSLFSVACTLEAAAQRPNVIVILADDLGYGDLSVQGHPLIRTPNIDRLAGEGQRWTQFYASAPLCNPSRVALLTGRLPIRISGNGKNEWANLPDSEITIAEMLKGRGYETGYIGKWGVGDLAFKYKGSHPNDQGFDYFFGLSHSNDTQLKEGIKYNYENVKHAKSEDFPMPLYRQKNIVESPVHQPTLTKRYTEESIEWIRARGDKPFFLFLAHNMPHTPIFRSPAFEGHSQAGTYGDVIEELDWSVGQVIQTLRQSGIAENTLVIFSSDNGPWLTYFDLGGSPGPFRDGKVTTWEGGLRVPGIFWWPGRIESSVVYGLGVNVDLMKTIATITGASLPRNRTFDSMDLSATLLAGAPSPRHEWFYYSKFGDLWAARVDQYKLVLQSHESIGKEGDPDRGYGNRQVHRPPLLFDLRTDISERLNIADRHPQMIVRIQAVIDRHRKSLEE